MNEQELAALAKQHGVTPQALLAALGVVAKATTVVSQDQGFYLIRMGCFETTVSKRDANTGKRALEYACADKLQAWYLVPKGMQILPEYVVYEITHNEWCDWVRS
jgi:hypothetical protein